MTTSFWEMALWSRAIVDEIRHPWKGGFSFCWKYNFYVKKRYFSWDWTFFKLKKNRFRTFIHQWFVNPAANADFRPSTLRRSRVTSDSMISGISGETSFWRMAKCDYPSIKVASVKYDEWSMFYRLQCTMGNPFVAGSSVLFAFIEIMETITKIVGKS